MTIGVCAADTGESLGRRGGLALPDRRTAGPSSGGMGRRTLTFVGSRRQVAGGAVAGHDENVARAPSGGSRGARAAAAELVCGLGHIIPFSAITSLSCDIYADVGRLRRPHMHALVRIACCGSGAGPPTLQPGRPVSPRGAGCRAACAQLRAAGGFASWRGASARLLGLKVCVCGPRSSRPSADRLPCLAVVRRCPCCAGGLVEWAARPTTTVVSSGVIVGLGACALQPHCAMACPGAAWVGLPRVRGGGWGAWGLVGRVTAQARGQLATESVARSG